MHQVLASRAVIGVAIVLTMGVPISRAQAPEEKKDETSDAAESSAGMTGVLRLGTMLPQTPITILMAPAVQAELKLNDTQKAKISDLALTAGQQYRESLQALLFSGEASPEEILSVRTSLRQENERAVGRLLDTKQGARLSQIVLQAEGPLAVSRPDVAAKLRLSETQNERIRNVMLQLQQTQRVMYATARRQAKTFSQLDSSRFGRVRDEMAKVRDVAVVQISKVLDRKQKANFNKMLGEPFDVAKLDPEASAEAKAKDTPSSDQEKTKSSGRSPRRKSRPKTSSS